MRSLSRQLTLGLVAAFLVLLGVAGATAFSSARKAPQQQFDQTLRTQALWTLRFIELRNETLRVHVSGMHTPFEPIMDDFSPDSGRTVFQVWDWEKNPVARSTVLGDEALPLKYGSAENPLFWDHQRTDGTPVRSIGIEFRPRLDDQHLPQYPARKAYLVLASDRTELDRAIRNHLFMWASAGIGLLAAIGIMVPITVRLGLRSLGDMTRQAEKITASDLSVRLPAETMPTELRPIGRCVNQLLDRLEDSFTRERRFNSDVAHELLTPLSEMRSLCEFALRYPDSDYREYLAQLLQILRRIEAIVECLFRMRRPGEQSPFLSETNPVSLLPLVRARETAFREKVSQRKLRLHISVPEEVKILADQAKLESIVTNLISNAVEYADPATTIAVQWIPAADQFALSFTNAASALEQADTEGMFEPFWRKDRARSFSRHGGLGLPLCREFAVSMGFKIDTRLSRSGTFTIALSGPVSAVVMTAPEAR